MSQFSGDAAKAKIRDIRTRAVNDLIDRQLILQEFQKLKGQIPEYVVEERVNSIIRDDYGGDRSVFLKDIALRGQTIDQFRKSVEEQVIVQAMRQREVKGDPMIPEGRVASYYHEHQQEWTQGDEVKLKMLKMKDDGNGDKRKMIEEIHDKVVRGADFGDMARIYSEDSNQDNNGDWGWVKRGDLAGDLNRIVFTLPTGKVSDVIALTDPESNQRNFYLLLAEAKKPGVTKPLSELRPDIERRLMQEERQKMQQSWINRLRKKAYIKIY
jgi:hypothetical protein